MGGTRDKRKGGGGAQHQFWKGSLLDLFTRITSRTPSSVALKDCCSWCYQMSQEIKSRKRSKRYVDVCMPAPSAFCDDGRWPHKISQFGEMLNPLVAAEVLSIFAAFVSPTSRHHFTPKGHLFRCPYSHYIICAPTVHASVPELFGLFLDCSANAQQLQHGQFQNPSCPHCADCYQGEGRSQVW